ncbi:MAG: acyltransferase, partial [Cyanobacteria bacterium J06649_11]
MGIKISRRNNFDLIRLLAALVVVAAHTADVSHYAAFEFLSATFNSWLAVDVFFIISVFLIYRSFEHSQSLTIYWQKRARRILPAYLTVILVAALGLSLISHLSLLEYFTHREFWQYIFFNSITLNFLQPSLPGVFTELEFQSVNMSLWTIKVEVMFYLAVPFIAYVLDKTNRAWGMLAIYLGSILYSTTVMTLSDRLGDGFVTQLEQQLPGQLAFFISGAFLYCFYEGFRQHIFSALAIASLILVVHNFVVELYFAYPLALAILVIYFCLIFKYLGNFGKYGDFSYGIYIWHFPILLLLDHFNLFEQPAIALPLFGLL